MSDFDLAQALDSSPEKSEIFVLSENLELMVTLNRKTMKGVANLVLAVNKLRKPLSLCGGDLSDDKLCSTIMDCVVGETVFQKGWHSSSGQRKPIFQRSRIMSEFMLCDTFKKNLILNSGELKLQAITLTGGYCDSRVSFEMRSYRPPCNSSIGSLIVLLSVAKDLHMSCSMKEGKVMLNLEKYREESLTEIDQDEGMDRFLFIKRISGVCLATFESVKYRGWFISTSSDECDQSVDM
ncbi:interleukin-1 beta [Anableps anableps]